MKHILSILLSFCFALQAVSATKDSTQKKATSLHNTTRYPIEKKATFLSVSYGVSNYLGDLGGNKGSGKGFIGDVNFKKRTSFIGFSISRLYKEAMGFRLGYTAGNLSGSDQDAAYANLSDPAYKRFKRNLDFETKISEWSLLLEVYPFKFIHRNKKIAHWHVQPYLIAGVGRYAFNPQGSSFDAISGDEINVDLQPLSTEGQGMKEYPDRTPYKLAQLNLPYGLGIQYKAGKKTAIAFEYIGRKLFTDYLDDVSTTYIDPSLFSNYFDEEQAATASTVSNKSMLVDPNNPYKTGDKRGNEKKNDFYFSFNLKVSVQINKKKVKPVTPVDVSPGLHYKFDNQELCY